MPAGTYDLTSQQGRAIQAYATFSNTIELVDAAGDPLDLGDFDPAITSGAQGMRAMFRLDYGTADPPIFDLKDPSVAGSQFPGSGIVIVSPSSQGKVTITISAATSGLNTQEVSKFGGRYDMVGVGKVAVAKDYIERLVQGAWEVSKGVTRGI
jgi:hypothetical protein